MTRRERLYAKDLLRLRANSFLLLRYYDDGARTAIGIKSPSVRDDVIKIRLIDPASLKIKELKLAEQPGRILTSGGVEYEPFTMTEREEESANRILAKMAEVEG